MRVRLKHQALATRLAESQLSQNHWAIKLSLSRGHLSDLVNGKRPYPSGKVRRKLLDGLECEFDKLFEVEFVPVSDPKNVAPFSRRIFDLRIGGFRFLFGRVSEKDATETKAQRGREIMSSFWDSLRRNFLVGLRRLVRHPAYAGSIALTLALGIASFATVFSFIETFLLRPVPGIPTLERVVNIRSITADGDDTALFLSFPNYRDLQTSASSLSEVAAFHGFQLAFGQAGENPRLIGSQLNTRNYFSILSLEPELGRFFSEEEDSAAGAQAVAVISESFWQSQFAGQASVLGQEIRLNGQPFTIIGVGPKDFRGHFLGFPFDIFLPSSMADLASRNPEDRRDEWVELIGSLAPGIEIMQARADVESVRAQLTNEFPEVNRHLTLRVNPTSGVEEDFRAGLVLFLGAFLLVALLILGSSCVNVANLMTARLLGRVQEMGVRQVMGARPSGITLQLIWESLALAAPGGFLGLGASWLAVEQLNRMLTAATGIEFAAGVGPTVIWLCVLTTFVIAIFLGILTTLRLRRGQLLSMIQEGGERGNSGTRLNGLLITAQVAICLILLVLAGLFVRALGRSNSLDPGFQAQGVSLLAVNPQRFGLDAQRTRAFYESVLREARLRPGIAATSLTDRIPLGFGSRFFSNTRLVNLEGHQPPVGEEGFWIESATVATQFFQALSIPILRGRPFDRGDRPEARPVVIVNQSFVDRFWPGQSGVGMMLALEQMQLEVVGVSATSKYRSITEPDLPFIYLPWEQTGGRARFVVRSSRSLEEVGDELRGIILATEPGLPVPALSELQGELDASLLPQRVGSALAGLMGLMALLQASVGLCGVVSFAVGQRQREIGIRISLGAQPRQIISLIQRQSLRPVFFGICLGLVPCLFGARQLEGFLQGVSPFDPLVCLGALAILLFSNLLAIYLPASRAANLDPSQTLRN